MEHENGTLAAHRVEWIGVSCTEVVRSVFSQSYHEFQAKEDRRRMGLDRDALLPITEHDQRKVRVPGVFT